MSRAVDEALATFAPPNPLRVKSERVIAENDGAAGWLVMWPDGSVKQYVSKQAVLMACKKRIGAADAMITTIEWRG